MSGLKRWPRRNAFALSSVLGALACAKAVDDPLENIEVPPIGGAGVATAGAMAAGAAGGAMGSGGATGGAGGVGAAGQTAAGTAGMGAGGMGAGGVGAGGVGAAGMGTAGMGLGGAGTGGAGKAGADTGGAGAAMGGAGQSNTSGSSGKGGASGATAGGGNGGAAGKGGTSGSGGLAGSGGTNTTAEGCARLSVPLNGASDKAHFTISLTNVADLSDSGTTISMRIYVQAGSGGTIFPYAQDPDFNFLGQDDRPLLADQDGWVTLRWNIAAEPNVTPAIDKSNVRRIGIEINAAPSMNWSNPTVVFVDSISVNSPALSFPFNTSGTVSTSTNQTSDPSSQVLWLNSDSSDTTASGTALSWVDTCP